MTCQEQEQSRKQQVDGWLSHGMKELGWSNRDSLPEKIDDWFGQVNVYVEPISYLPEHVVNDITGKLNQELNRVASEWIADAIKYDTEKYFKAIIKEMSRRLAGEEPIQQDEAGEWLIEHGHVTDSFEFSMLGDIVTARPCRKLYRKLDYAVKKIVKQCGGECELFSRFYGGRYIIDAENNDIMVTAETGHPSAISVSHMRFG